MTYCTTCSLAFLASLHCLSSFFINCNRPMTTNTVSQKCKLRTIRIMFSVAPILQKLSNSKQAMQCVCFSLYTERKQKVPTFSQNRNHSIFVQTYRAHRDDEQKLGLTSIFTMVLPTRKPLIGDSTESVTFLILESI